MTDLKDTLLRWWFLFSALALAALYFWVDKRGRTIKQLQDDAQRQLLAQKLLSIREQSRRSGVDYVKALESYDDLKRRHADVLTKFGLFTGSTPPKSDPH